MYGRISEALHPHKKIGADNLALKRQIYSPSLERFVAVSAMVQFNFDATIIIKNPEYHGFTNYEIRALQEREVAKRIPN